MDTSENLYGVIHLRLDYYSDCIYKSNEQISLDKLYVVNVNLQAFARLATEYFKGTKSQQLKVILNTLQHPIVTIERQPTSPTNKQKPNTDFLNKKNATTLKNSTVDSAQTAK